MRPALVKHNFPHCTPLPLQIQKVVMALGDYMGASCHACIGGTNVRAEVQKLQMEAPHIIVGTPGRVFDMLNRRYLCECPLALALSPAPCPARCHALMIPHACHLMLPTLPFGEGGS